MSCNLSYLKFNIMTYIVQHDVTYQLTTLALTNPSTPERGVIQGPLFLSNLCDT